MLAIVTTHPIQYQLPLWQALARDTDVPFEVWYLTSHATGLSLDQQFGKSFAWDLEMLSGYPHRFLKTAPGATPNTFWRCRFDEPFTPLLSGHKVKAVWIQGWQVAGYWQAVWAAKAAGAEVWLRGESNDLAPAPLWKALVKRLVVAQLFRRVDRFLYIGSANRRLYRNFGIAEEKLYPAPYAVDNERFARQAKALRSQRSGIRNEWNIPEDAFCVLFCGKFIPKKRPLDLVRAVQHLEHRAEGRKIHLLFVGSGELGLELRGGCNVVFDAENLQVTSDFRPATPKGCKPSASFTGFLNQTEISRAYVAADVLVLPSDHGETWGLVVNEAMASGLPCIISDHCGCAPDLGRLNCNRTFDCGDINELLKQLREATTTLRSMESGIEELPSIAQTVATIASSYHEI